MERLTSRNEDCVLVNGHGLYHLTMTEVVQMADRLAAYEDTGREPEEVTALRKLFDYALKESKTLTEQLTLLHHIRELAEADKDGRVIVLPAKKGDTLYAVTRFGVEKQKLQRHFSTILTKVVIGQRSQPILEILVRPFSSPTKKPRRLCGKWRARRMAKYVTKAQLRQLYQAQLIDNDEYLRLLKEFAGIESRPTTEYNHYDENGEFIGSSVDTDLSDLLDEAGVEVRDDGPT